MRKYLATGILMLAAGSAVAQHAVQDKDTVLKGSTIEVIQSYKPVIKPAPKPEWMPSLPPADTSHPTFNYDVPQQTLYYTYSSLPLRPLALGKEIIKVPFPNYVKVGGGNLSTLFLDAGIGGISGKSYETNIHLHHISQKGDISYQQSSLSGVEAEGLIHNPKAEWRIAAQGELNQYYYYGYRHDLFSYNSADSLKQTYTGIRAGIGLKPGSKSTSKFTYDLNLSGSLYTAAFSTTETKVDAHLPFEYKFDKAVQALLTADANIARLTTGSVGADNNLVALLPGLRVRLAPFTGHAIVGFAFGANNKNYVLPDIEGTVKLSNRAFISAGYQLTVRQNTYEQLTLENPYIMNTYSIMQTKRDELFGELRGGVGDHLSYNARISWWNFTALPTFLNDFWDWRRFNVVYDNVQALAFQLSARYKVANKWSFGGEMDFYNFTNSAQSYPWHQPGTRIRGDFMVAITQKFIVSAYMSFLGGIHALDLNHKVVTLDPAFDIGGNAEYQIVKRASAFVQIDNLLNNTYERWYGYKSYGLNIYGGLRLKF